MSPAEVPDALVEKAARAVWDLDPAVADGDWPAWDESQPDQEAQDDLRDEMRHALAAVLPEYRPAGVLGRLLRFAQAVEFAERTWRRRGGQDDVRFRMEVLAARRALHAHLPTTTAEEMTDER